MKEAHGGKVTALSLGPENATDALKQALAMGCDEAILLSDPAFAGADSLVVSKIIAAALDKIGEIDLVCFGRGSVDSDTGVTGSQVARRMGWPVLNLVSEITDLDPEGKTLAVERMLDESRQQVRASMPVVLSVVKEINEPRYPSFMGIRKASKAEIPLWSKSDIGLDDVPQSAVSWPEIFAPPKVETEVEMIEGDTPEQKAVKLADRLLEEKVI